MSDTALASEWLPLAPAQLDFWEEHTLHPGQTLSTVAHCTELCGAVEEETLCRAIATTLAETQAFALRFGERHGDSPRCYVTIHSARRHCNASICKRTTIPGRRRKT